MLRASPLYYPIPRTTGHPSGNQLLRFRVNKSPPNGLMIYSQALDQQSPELNPSYSNSSNSGFLPPVSNKSRVQEPQGHTDWNTHCPFTPFPSSLYLGQSDVMQASPTHGITTASMSTTPSDQSTSPSYSLGILLTPFFTLLHRIIVVATDTKQAPNLASS